MGSSSGTGQGAAKPRYKAPGHSSGNQCPAWRGAGRLMTSCLGKGVTCSGVLAHCPAMSLCVSGHYSSSNPFGLSAGAASLSLRAPGALPHLLAPHHLHVSRATCSLSLHPAEGGTTRCPSRPHFLSWRLMLWCAFNTYPLCTGTPAHCGLRLTKD